MQHRCVHTFDTVFENQLRSFHQSITAACMRIIYALTQHQSMQLTNLHKFLHLRFYRKHNPQPTLRVTLPTHPLLNSHPTHTGASSICIKCGNRRVSASSMSGRAKARSSAYLNRPLKRPPKQKPFYVFESWISTVSAINDDVALSDSRACTGECASPAYWRWCWCAWSSALCTRLSRRRRRRPKSLRHQPQHPLQPRRFVDSSTRLVLSLGECS